MDINITGLKDESKSDWQERAKSLCKPKNFTIKIIPDYYLLEDLSDEEVILLESCIRLIERYAALMACGMLKGVLKYASDIETDNEHNSVESWMSYLLGEGADFSNYQALLMNAFERGQK